MLERDIGIPYVYYAVDINTPLNDGNGYLKPEYMDSNIPDFRDGLHPDEDAHAMIGQTIIDTLFTAPPEFEVDPDNVQVVAHRGCYMETSFPENSLSAIGACIGSGVDVIEIDVRETSDGHLVLMHDEDVQRTTTSTAALKVSDLTLNQIKTFSLSNGEKVPTLTEVMLFVKNSDVLINLDKVTSTHLIAKAITVLQTTGTLDKAIFKSTNMATPSQGILYMPIVDCRSGVDTCRDKLEYLKTNPTFAVEVMYGSDDNDGLEPIFEELNMFGVKVWANSLWSGTMSGGYSDNTAKTGDFDGSFGELIDMGVTMIQTDYPLVLLNYLDELNLAKGCIIFHGDTQHYETHKNIVASIEAEECEYYYLFHVGDLTDYGGDSGHWRNFLEAEGDLISNGMFYPVVGNHEFYGDGTSEYGVTEIVNGISEVAPYIGEMLGEYGTYVEEVTDDLVFIGLNNGVKYDMGYGFTNFCRQQEAVLRQALVDNVGKDVIVAYHAPAFPLLPRYSSDFCASTYWHPIIAEFASQGNKVVVISGHTHGLSYAEKEGVVYLESGSGGGPLDTKKVCRATAEEAGVDYWGGCERTNGYYICDVGLNECIAKDILATDPDEKNLFTVDIS
jgi:glycerophosphoryl diester phosphodiesterase